MVMTVIAVAGLVLSACSGAADGSAQSTSASNVGTSTEQELESSHLPDSNSSSNDLPKNGAPHVENPLDVSMLKGDECAAMTEKQAKEFPGNFDETRMRNDDCEWIYRDDMFIIGGVGGSLDLDHPGGLSDYYGNADSDSYELEPIDPIKGYPAINFDIGKEGSGSCAIKVGVRDDLVYTSLPILDPGHPSYDKPCEIAREFAEVVVENLKEAQ